MLILFIAHSFHFNMYARKTESFLHVRACFSIVQKLTLHLNAAFYPLYARYETFVILLSGIVFIPLLQSNQCFVHVFV